MNHWAKLNIAPGTKVFVPLCGKSCDMTWLADQGHPVIGAELSELAISAFYEAVGLTPNERRHDTFRIMSAGSYELWCGDLFAIPVEALNGVDAIYDRASLIALPQTGRKRYVTKLSELAPAAKILLISLAYNEAEMAGPPFSVPQAEIQDLFAPTHTIEIVERRHGIGDNENLKKRGLTDLEETCYLLAPKP